MLTAASSGTSTNEIIRDTDGKVYSYNGLKYLYDSEGKPLGFTSGSYEYYFRYNLQGDVTGLINASTGSVDAIYEYDAHGNIISRTAKNSIATNLTLRNIYLYRGAYGYFYEKNSGLYYLQTRFYDPVVGRFLNADDTDYLNASGTTLGCNLYAYCENNAVNCLDPNGCTKSIWSLKSDWAGRQILFWWLFGGGVTRQLMTSSWANYMKNNRLLKNKVRKLLKDYSSRAIKNKSVRVVRSVSMEIDNGEDIIGYQYLHGTNYKVGGFSIETFIYKYSNGEISFTSCFVWNDIIDPNFNY